MDWSLMLHGFLCRMRLGFYALVGLDRCDMSILNFIYWQTLGRYRCACDYAHEFAAVVEIESRGQGLDPDMVWRGEYRRRFWQAFLFHWI